MILSSLSIKTFQLFPLFGYWDLSYFIRSFVTSSKYLHSVLVSIQLMWTRFPYLSILTLVSILFLQSDVDISVLSMTSIETDLALWLCKLLKVLQNNRLFSGYLSALYCLSLDTCTLFGQLHMRDTLYSYSASLVLSLLNFCNLSRMYFRFFFNRS